MKQARITTQRIALVFLFVLVLAFGMIHSASAQGIIYGDSLAAGKVIENDIILMGDKVVLDGTVEGDVLAIGSTVQINGAVKGSLAVISQKADITGEVDGTFYSADLMLGLGASAILHRNLYYLGLGLETQPGSVVERDLVTICLFGARLEGEIGRSIRAIIGPLELVTRLIELFGGQKILSFEHQIPVQAGVLWRTGGADKALTVQSAGLNGMKMLGAPKVVFPWLSSPSQGGQIDVDRLNQWISARLKELLSLFIIGLLGIWLFREQFSRTSQGLREKPWAALGYGLLALIVVFILFILAILLVILVFAVAIWLGVFAPYDISLTIWAVGLSALVLATSLLALFVLYGTKIIVAYWAGMLILKPLGPKAVRYKVVPLLLGLVLYVLLHSIPILGWVIGILVTAFGLGAVVVLYFDVRLRKPEPEVIEAPLVEASNDPI